MADLSPSDPHALQIRNNLASAYPDVYTAEARAALAALAPLNELRLALMAARIQRRAARARERRRLDFLPPESTIGGTDIRVQDARQGKFQGGEIPAGPRAAVDPGDRSGDPSRRAAGEGPAQRGLRAAVGRRRLDVRRRGRPGPGLEHVARQPAQPEAGHRPRPAVPAGGRAGGGEMNDWARGFFGRAIIADWQEQLGFTTKIFRRPRAAPRRSPRAPGRRHRAFGLDRRSRPCTW